MTIGEILGMLRDSSAVAGGAGGAFRWLSLKPRNWRGLLIAVLLGVIAAEFVSPAMVPLVTTYTGADILTASRLSAFTIGAIGMGLVGFALDYLAARSGKMKNDNDK